MYTKLWYKINTSARANDPSSKQIPDKMVSQPNFSLQNLPTHILPPLAPSIRKSLASLIRLVPRQETMATLLYAARRPEGHATYAEVGSGRESAGLGWSLAELRLGQQGGD